MPQFGSLILLFCFPFIIYAQENNIIIPEFKHFKNDFGRVTRLPIPRFVSLKKKHTNMRKGPGKKYHIKWEYHKKGLPVEVINEYAHWRKVRDIDGSEGWIHYALLSGKKMIVTITNKQNIYKHKNTHSEIIAKINAGVVLNPIQCTDKWCKISYQKILGWIEKDSIYGVYPDEILH